MNYVNKLLNAELKNFTEILKDCITRKHTQEWKELNAKKREIKKALKFLNEKNTENV